MLKSGDCPWCVFESEKDEDKKQTFYCRGCKQKHKMNMVGMTIDEFVKLSEAFCELHKNCKP